MAVHPWKMTPNPWRACPPWGWAGATSAGLVGPSPHDISDWRVAWALIAIGAHPAIAYDFVVILVNIRVFIFVRGILLHVGELGFAAGFPAIISGPR